MAKNWVYTTKIEDMTPAQLKERIRQGYEYKTKKLVIIPYLGESEVVTYDCPEVIARCPATGIVDIYRLVIDFVPGKYIPELKSLKLYLLDFVDVPISHEHLCSKIYREFKRQVKPKKLYIRLLTNVRGGI